MSGLTLNRLNKTMRMISILKVVAKGCVNIVGNNNLETMMTRTMTSPRRKLAMLAVTTELKKTQSIEGMHRRIVDFL